MAYVEEEEDHDHAREGECELGRSRRIAARQQARRLRVRETAFPKGTGFSKVSN